jgi:hypothetical protein
MTFENVRLLGIRSTEEALFEFVACVDQTSVKRDLL